MSLRQRWREWRESGAEHAAAAEEMRFHIERETEHNIRRGMSPQEARRAAGRAFGGVDRFVEIGRDERTGTGLSEFAASWLDWKLGGRMLAKHPGVTLIAGVTLALAIGLGAAWFEFSMMELFRRLPFADGERIVRIESWDAEAAEPEERSLHDYLQWREQLSSIEPPWCIPIVRPQSHHAGRPRAPGACRGDQRVRVSAYERAATARTPACER